MFQRLNLLLDLLMLLQLPLQKPPCHSCLFGHRGRGELVEVGALVLAVAEVLCLHPSLLLESLQAIVELTQALAELGGELALGEIGIVLQSAEELVAVVVCEQGAEGELLVINGHRRLLWEARISHQRGCGWACPVLLGCRRLRSGNHRGPR